MKQIYRRTKTGNYLTLIQGEGLGTGIATGNLRLVQNETIEAERLLHDTRRYAYQIDTRETAPPTLIETVLIWLFKIGA